MGHALPQLRQGIDAVGISPVPQIRRWRPNSKTGANTAIARARDVRSRRSSSCTCPHGRRDQVRQAGRDRPLVIIRTNLAPSGTVPKSAALFFGGRVSRSPLRRWRTGSSRLFCARSFGLPLPDPFVGLGSAITNGTQGQWRLKQYIVVINSGRQCNMAFAILRRKNGLRW